MTHALLIWATGYDPGAHRAEASPPRERPAADDGPVADPEPRPDPGPGAAG